MKKLLILASAFLLVFWVVGAASATTWTDTYLPGQIPLYMVAPDEETLSFNIRNDGFDAGFFNLGITGNNVLSYQVEIYATDDFFEGANGIADFTDWGSRGKEYMTISTGWWYGDPVSFEVGLGGDTYGDNLLGLLDINFLDAGRLDLNLQATQGDFYLWGAKLTASDSKPVPEPATMLLLGLGLVGLAGFGRKKFNS